MNPTATEVESAEEAVERARLKWRNDTSGHKARYYRDYVKARMQAVSLETYVEKEKHMEGQRGRV